MGDIEGPDHLTVRPGSVHGQWFFTKEVAYVRADLFDALTAERDALRRCAHLGAIDGPTLRTERMNDQAEVLGYLATEFAAGNRAKYAALVSHAPAAPSEEMSEWREERERQQILRCAQAVFAYAHSILMDESKNIYAKQLMDDQRFLRTLIERAPESAPPRYERTIGDHSLHSTHPLTTFTPRPLDHELTRIANDLLAKHLDAAAAQILDEMTDEPAPSPPPPHYTESEIREAIAECWRDDLDAIGNIIDLVLLSRHRDAESTPPPVYDREIGDHSLHSTHPLTTFQAERGDRNASTGTFYCAHCKVENASPGHTCTGVVPGIINVASTEPGIENRPSESYAMRIFDLLEHWLPEYRAGVFYEIEKRWCWTCGKDQFDGDHAGCGAPDPTSRPPQVAGESERETTLAGIARSATYDYEAMLLNDATDPNEAFGIGFRYAANKIADAIEAASLIERVESERERALKEAAQIALDHRRLFDDEDQDIALDIAAAIRALTPKGAVQGQGSAE